MTPRSRSRAPVLLAVGPGSRTTGYSRVLANILSGVAKSLEVVHFAFENRGAAPLCEYRVIPNLLPGDRLGKRHLPALLAQYHPDIVFLYHDIDFYTVHRNALNRYKQENPRAAVVLYCPVEWETTLPANLAPLAEADRAVFFTDFGRNLYLNTIQNASVKETSQSTVIPHGVDTTHFFPLVEGNSSASRSQARAALFPQRPELQNAFVVLNANRNSRRKRIELSLQIFAEFCRDKPDAYLYLHMGMLDRGCDVLETARALAIESRLLVTTLAADKPDVSEQHLNRIYNACDVGINTSTGEGWGLVAMEHAATGAPQILPAYSACLELWSEHGILIPANIDDRSLDTGHAVRQLNLLYAQPKYRSLLSQRSLHYARNPKFSWERIAREWTALFAGCAGIG